MTGSPSVLPLWMNRASLCQSPIRERGLLLRPEGHGRTRMGSCFSWLGCGVQKVRSHLGLPTALRLSFRLRNLPSGCVTCPKEGKWLCSFDDVPECSLSSPAYAGCSLHAFTISRLIVKADSKNNKDPNAHKESPGLCLPQYTLISHPHKQLLWGSLQAPDCHRMVMGVQFATPEFTALHECSHSR